MPAFWYRRMPGMQLLKLLRDEEAVKSWLGDVGCFLLDIFFFLILLHMADAWAINRLGKAPMTTSVGTQKKVQIGNKQTTNNYIRFIITLLNILEQLKLRRYC